MKKVIYIGLIFLCFQSFAQDDTDLLNDLIEEETAETAYLPERMLFTQRALWGQKGLYRKLGVAPKVITAESREHELKARRTMFRIHQAIGLVTAGGMLAQGIVGTKLYKGNYELKPLHEGIATGINIAYGTTALMAFAAPPPMVNRKKFDNIKLHKLLSIVHLSGMIGTNILARQTDQGMTQKKLHKAVGLTTFAAYTAAIASIKFEF